MISDADEDTVLQSVNSLHSFYFRVQKSSSEPTLIPCLN